MEHVALHRILQLLVSRDLDLLSLLCFSLVLKVYFASGLQLLHLHLAFLLAILLDLAEFGPTKVIEAGY